MEYEITSDLKLTESQAALLEMHSFVNLMSVLISELQTLESRYAQNGMFRDIIQEAVRKLESFSHPESGRRHAEDLAQFEGKVLRVITRAMEKHPGKAVDPGIVELTENLENVLSILGIHAREILSRNHEPEKWIPFEVEELYHSLVRFLSALEKNSKGKFRIVYNIADKQEKDYMVGIQINSIDGDVIVLPAVLTDLMRDLLANARKYTQPGGRITFGLVDDGQQVRIVVDDTGRGIPENEITSIVQFGVRASNVQPHETRGGGFGLTKAYFITRQFKGRMWIRSMPGQGTRITIHSPRENQRNFLFPLF